MAYARRYSELSTFDLSNSDEGQEMRIVMPEWGDSGGDGDSCHDCENQSLIHSASIY